MLKLLHGSKKEHIFGVLKVSITGIQYKAGVYAIPYDKAQSRVLFDYNVRTGKPPV